MTTLWLDTETYSECDLKRHSTHRYAEHHSTEITVAQWAIDDGEPVVEDLTGALPPSAQLVAHLADPDIEVVAHNSRFDRILVRHVWGIEVPIERWRDTMIKAMVHGLPGALGKVGQVLGLDEDQAKDKRGPPLIRMFGNPCPINAIIKRKTRETPPVGGVE